MVTMAAARYDWRTQGNADRLGAHLELYIAAHGARCQGYEPDGAGAHPSSTLEPVPRLPMAAGGSYESEILVLCPFCVQRYMLIVEQALANIAARQSSHQ